MYLTFGYVRRPVDVDVIAISALRTYALNPDDRMTPVAVLVLALGPPVYQMVGATHLRTR